MRPGGSAHPRSVAEDRRALKDRAGKTRGRIWLFAIIEDGKIAFETCWLPNVPEVVRRLGPVGFRRQPDGAFRASVDVRAELDIRRAVGKAFEVMLREEVGS